MRQAVSPSTGDVYGLSRVCRVWELARSTVYAQRWRGQQPPEPPRRRGPRQLLSDEMLTQAIRDTLASSPWLGEGYRKVWAQLRLAGIHTSKRRVLRLMREANLLAPTRTGHPHGPKAHEGTITTARPDEMWGIDITGTMTTQEGNANVFILVDHCTAECLGIHATHRATRIEAVEPLRQAVRDLFGAYDQGAAAGVALRHDHGSQFLSDHFQRELTFLGMTSSPAFVREPEGNGCAERFIRTLKEQLLWVRCFATIDELQAALQEFKRRYNSSWLLERHGFISPAAARRGLSCLQVAA
jgi:transposase InsO family protein